jgi:hypothetical protein
LFTKITYRMMLGVCFVGKQCLLDCVAHAYLRIFDLGLFVAQESPKLCFRHSFLFIRVSTMAEQKSRPSTRFLPSRGCSWSFETFPSKHNRSEDLPHVFFADDMMLFAEASTNQMGKIMSCLNELCVCIRSEVQC